MNVRTALFALAVSLSHCAAMAQSQPSPLGTWSSDALVSRDYPVAAVVQLTVSNVDADQRASGRFAVFLAGAVGSGSSNCFRGPVSGRYEGGALKMTSTASNLCPERLFDLKFSGDDVMAGMYRGADGEPVRVTFRRDR